MMRRKQLWVAVLLVPLALSACSNDSGEKKAGSTSGSGQVANMKVAVVTHASAGDAFWDVVKKGAEAAGKQYGIDVTYESSSGDPQQQAQLIDTEVSKKVDGLVVSMANPDALKDSVTKAVRAGIPVITINSGEDRSKEFGAITHVGQSEDVAGQGAGQKLKEAGVHHLVCVIHEAGNVGLEQRCAGAKRTLGAPVDNLQVDINNLSGVEATIRAKLQADKTVDGVLALNGGVAAEAAKAVKDAGVKAKVATFDLNADVIEAIEAGDILFAVDQQQYLQGYLPVSFLYLYKTNLDVVGGGQPVLTGPSFVTKDNAKAIAELAASGTR